MESEFILDGILVAGVALGPLVSIIISIIKHWVKMDKKVIALLNVVLGIVAVVIYGIVEGGLTVPSAIVGAIGISFTSSLFHDTFGNGLDALREFLGKKE